MTVRFITATEIPLQSFTLLGINVKTKTDAIGRFGTGLKYAVAVILRHGGTIRLFISGTEYEFYLHGLKFRGKDFQQVRMRKRATFGGWLSSKALPFTTEFGKDWGLWQAYRELESNTRDESGHTTSDGIQPEAYKSGTVIEVDCPGFQEAIDEEQVFFDPGDKPKVNSCDIFDMYEGESKHFYYQGIRVYTLRYPARFTYNFKSPYVRLTEDRTADNAFSLFYWIAQEAMKLSSNNLVTRMLVKSDNPCMETHDLNFDVDKRGSDVFVNTARAMHAGGSLGRSYSNWFASAPVNQEPGLKEVSYSLTNPEWELIIKAVERGRHWDQDWSDDSERAYQRLLRKREPF
jgi:hypothetical protein